MTSNVQRLGFMLGWVRNEPPSVREYRHKPLYPQSFRYLELLPGTKDDEIRYSLKLGDLRKPPEYEALSYTWGDPNVKVPSHCDGKLLHITPNLRDALQHLRHEKQKRLLWADAICIDQKNSLENAHRVSNIKKIYGNASRVIVWLGMDEPSEDGNSTKAKIAAERIDGFVYEVLDHYNSMDPSEKNVTIRNSGKPVSEPWTAEDYTALPPSTKLQLEHLHRLLLFDLVRKYPFAASRWSTEADNCVNWLLQRPWFSRLWVVQQVSSSAKPAIFHCGDVQLIWEHVLMLCIWFNSRADSRINASMPHQSVERVVNMYTPIQDTTEALVILDRSSLYEATDPKDYFYANMGDHAMKKIAKDTWINYGIATQTLLKTIFHWFVYNDGNLDVLSFAQRVGNLDNDIASWVPQWHMRATVNQMVRSHHMYNASGSSKPVYSFPNLANLNIVLIDGIFFDIVSAVSDSSNLRRAWISTASGEFRPQNASQDTHPFVVSFQEHQNDLDVYQNDLLEAIGAACVVGKLDVDGPGSQRRTKDAPEIHSADTKAIYKYLREGDNGSCTEDCNLGRRHIGCWRQFAVKALDASRGRTYVTTERGYVGLAPENVRKGDMICVLYGGNVPYALRTVEGYFRFLGECYVHGIMDGEVMEMLSKGRFEKTEFDIR